MTEYTALDGVVVAAGGSEEGSAPTGSRPLLVGELRPVERASNGKSGLSDALAEMSAAGWPPDSVACLAQWLALPPADRARVQPRDGFESGAESFSFLSDPTLARPPFPIDLLHVPTAPGQPPFLGPRAARHWLGALQADGRPASPAPTRLSDATYERETIESMGGTGPVELAPVGGPRSDADRGDATDVIIEPEALRVRVRARSWYDLGSASAPELHYLVPLRSVSRVEVLASWSTFRPVFGQGRALYDHRGHGGLSRLDIRLSFSDGWRLSTVSLSGRAVDGIREKSLSALVRNLLIAIDRVQGGGPDPGPGEFPLPGPGGPSEDGAVSATYDFPSAVHFGIGLAAELLLPVTL